MIVPRTRLIYWAAGIVLPFAAIGATIPAAFAIAVLFIAGLGIVVLADALIAPGRLAGLRVQMPGMVRLQNGRHGTIPMRVFNESEAARLLRVGIAFPREISSPRTDWTIAIPAGVMESSFEWECTPMRRGAFPLRDFHLEVASPFGFWAARTKRPAQGEIRVYPDLLSERRQVASLFLRRADTGIHAQRSVGQGREFEKLREFVPGDSLSDIHWKASAKRGKPVTKVHQVERSHEVYIVIDASRLSARKVTMLKSADGVPASEARSGLVPLKAESVSRVETTALERYVTAAMLLALSTERQGDQFGLITFSDRVSNFVRARNGQAHFDACRDRLYTLQPQDVSPDFEELCTFIRLRLRKRALVIFLTSLDDPVLAESFTKATELISRQQLVIANMLQPAGAQFLFSEKSTVGKVDDLYRRLGGHLQWGALRELQKVLQRRGVRLGFLNPERLSAELIAQHAEIRARQLL